MQLCTLSLTRSSVFSTPGTARAGSEKNAFVAVRRSSEQPPPIIGMNLSAGGGIRVASFS